jgi:hypothetical protein
MKSFPITGGVFLAPEVCYPIWRMLQRDADAMLKRDAARPTPEVREAMQALRSAAQAFMSSNGHPERTSADIPIASVPERQVLTTSELAGLLRVGEKQARRIANEQAITPIARGLWSMTDARHLEAIRNGRNELSRREQQ